MGIGRKLLEEIVKLIGYKIIHENSYGVKSEASWNGIIKGYNGFPDGKNIVQQFLSRNKRSYYFKLGRCIYYK
jgi:hypothetical protein